MKNTTVMWLLMVAAVLLPRQEAGANALMVTNTCLWNPQLSQRYAYVSVDVSWSNSWRSSMNWDAAWVFVKFKGPGSNDWQHAWLSTNSADHIMPAGCTNRAAPDGTGVFIYRTDIATGGVSFAQVKLMWNYGTNGYTFAQGDQIPICVQAIEMVYVPTAPFWLGSTGTGVETSPFYQYTNGSQSTNAYYVASENAITVGMGNGNLHYTNSTYSGDGVGTISNLFPKGYDAFYCMKYEISQGQWVNFFNMLTAPQKTNHNLTLGPLNMNGKGAQAEVTRNTFSWTGGVSDASITNSAGLSIPDRACSFLSWADGAAYVDWAGLRPMTELEYEKACRGVASPVQNEYAWGGTTVTQLTAEVAGNTRTSTVSTVAGANCCYGSASGIQGPTRCGIFATATSERVQAGASYWGIMELSGNLEEWSVTVGNATGRYFQGTHGDGALDENGYANVSDWPLSNGAGAGLRGGSWFHVKDYMCVSDRVYASRLLSIRYDNFGWRGVRRAP